MRTVKSLLGFIRVRKKKYVFLKIVTALKDTAATLVATVAPGIIINELIGERRLSRLVLYVAVFALTPLVSRLIGSLLGNAANRARSEISIQLEADFFRNTATMDYEQLENPDILTKKERASDTVNGAVDVIDSLVDFGAAIVSVSAVFAILVNLNAVVIAVIALTVYINSLITKWVQKKNYQTGIDVDKESRKAWGYGYILDNFHFAKDIRLFNIGEMVVEKIVGSERRIANMRLQLQKKQNRAGILMAGISCAEQILLYAYLIFLIFMDRLTVGGLTVYQSATSQFFSSLSTIVNEYLKLCEKSLTTDELVEFLNIPKKQFMCGNAHPTFDNDSVIEFRNVSFKYPGSDRYALENLNLKIHGGNRLCIVGENGSGKSTFIKLLMRLYFPTEGEIFLNGRNINEYDYLEYQRIFSPAFQDFALFYFSLGENIAMTEKCDGDRLDKVCRKSGLDGLVSKLTKGYDTFVDKWVDEEGFEPSGGEGQRIAIARALYKGGDIYILDEPTAALDPMAEYEIYTQFGDMIENKTAVLITHRLSAVQLADKVAVFDSGHVIEYGTHDELYSQGGVYKEMFDKQSEFYVKANAESAED